jgi:hypothetical protein
MIKSYKQFVAFITGAILACLLSVAIVQPAAAQQDIATLETKQSIVSSVTYNPNVAPISCPQEDSCDLDYYGNGDGVPGNDYWMGKNAANRWVRLTLAAGLTTVGVGQITCAYEDSCDLDYTGGAWYAKQKTGTKYVRLTMVPSDMLVSSKHGVCDPSAAFCENEYEPDSTLALPYWAQGWQFEGRTVCIESTRAGAPLASVRNDYITAVNGLLQFTPATAVGECTSRGYPLSQQIKVYSYSSATDGYCGYAQTWTLGGYVHHAVLYINEAPERVGCRDAASWPSLWEHEVGHITGLAHVPATENSVMPSVLNDKRITPQVDGPREANLYTGNPLYGDGNP